MYTRYVLHHFPNPNCGLDTNHHHMIMYRKIWWSFEKVRTPWHHATLQSQYGCTSHDVSDLYFCGFLREITQSVILYGNLLWSSTKCTSTNVKYGLTDSASHPAYWLQHNVSACTARDIHQLSYNYYNWGGAPHKRYCTGQIIYIWYDGHILYICCSNLANCINLHLGSAPNRHCVILVYYIIS